MSWHSSSCLLVLSSERGQLHCLDRALNVVQLRLRASNTVQHEGSAALHLQQYLRQQPSLASLKWASLDVRGAAVPSRSQSPSRRKSERSRRKSKGHAAGSSLPLSGMRSPCEYLLVCFERGPLVCLRVSTGCWPSSCRLSALTLCSEYLQWQQFEAAIQLLLSLNWTRIASFQVFTF